MEQTVCSETSAYKIQTPGNYPEENIQHTKMCIKLENEPTFKRINRANHFKCHIIVISCWTSAKMIRPTSVCFLPFEFIFHLYNYRVVCRSPEVSPLEFLSEEYLPIFWTSLYRFSDTQQEITRCVNGMPFLPLHRIRHFLSLFITASSTGSSLFLVLVFCCVPNSQQKDIYQQKHRKY